MCLNGHFCGLQDDFALNSTTTNFQHYVHVDAVKPAGDWVAVLQSCTASPETTAIRRFSSSTPYGPEVPLGGNGYMEAAVTSLPDGRLIVVNAPGTLTSFTSGANPTLLSTLGSQSLSPTPPPLPYESIATIASDTVVAAGTTSWRQYKVNSAGAITAQTVTGATGGPPQILAFSDGRWLLRVNGDFTQRYTQAGVAVGAALGSSIGSGGASAATILTDTGSTADVFAVAYVGDTQQLNVRAYDWSGNQGLALDVRDATLTAQAQSQAIQGLVGFSDGNALVIYEQYVSYPDQRVVGQLVRRSGLSFSLSDVPVPISPHVPSSLNTAERYLITAASIGNNRVVVAWTFYTSSAFYVARGQILQYVP